MIELPIPEAPPFEELVARSKWLSEVRLLPELALSLRRRYASLRKERRCRARSLVSSGVTTALIKRSLQMLAASCSELPRALAEARPRRSRGDAAQAVSKRVVSRIGPTAVKVGQFIATASGFLPDPIVAAFSWCRDDVDPLPFYTVWATVRHELGRDFTRLLAEVNEEPLASASIAQTHLGMTRDGRAVVIKVRRPGLLRAFSRDIQAMASLARYLDKVSAGARVANLPAFVEIFASLVLEELDFLTEALNMIEVGLALEHAGHDFVRVPRPIPPFLTERVMVMEHVPGVPYTELDWARLSPAQRERILREAISASIEHALVYGIFHGDLHAGNVLVNDDGLLSVVDFGIVGRLTDHERSSLALIALGFALDDLRAQLMGFMEFGAIPSGTDLGALAESIEADLPPPQAITQRDLPNYVAQLVRTISKHRLKLPPALFLFLKNLLYLNGFAAAATPDLDLLSQITPIFEYFFARYPEHLQGAISALSIARPAPTG